MALVSISIRLGFTYSEDFGPAPRADILNRRALVLHCDDPWVLDLNLLSAFHAIRLHLNLLFILDLLVTTATSLVILRACEVIASAPIKLD